MDFINIRYSVSRRIPGSRRRRDIEVKNGKMRLKGVWGLDATHQKIKALIHRRHPGWLAQGWAIVR